jgi:hypothetical protein
MLVWELMEACISVCMCAKSSIHRSSCSIPSVEFSTTNSPVDEGKLFVHSNPLNQVHIVYTSVTKLLLAERLVLLHLLGATDANVIDVHGHRNIIVCKIADRPPPPVSCGEGTKDEDRAEYCDPSLEHEPEPQMYGPDENACFTPPINFFFMHNTCNNNTQQVPGTLGVSVSISQTSGRKQMVV